MPVLLTGEPVDAHPVLTANLVSKVVPYDELLDAAEAKMATILGDDQAALESAKETIFDVIGRPLDDQLASRYTCAMPTGRAAALLQETGLVGHHHPGRVAQPVQHVAAQGVAHRVGVPGVEVQQPLHAIRAQVTGLLGDRPRVLALCPRQQP
jgi:enoyl-CoA hydratase/carnithine racemase